MLFLKCHVLFQQRKEHAVIHAWPRRTCGPFVVELLIPLELLRTLGLIRQAQLSQR